MIRLCQVPKRHIQLLPLLYFFISFFNAYILYIQGLPQLNFSCSSVTLSSVSSATPLIKILHYNFPGILKIHDSPIICTLTPTSSPLYTGMIHAPFPYWNGTCLHKFIQHPQQQLYYTTANMFPKFHCSSTQSSCFSTNHFIYRAYYYFSLHFPAPTLSLLSSSPIPLLSFQLRRCLK